jgi:DNA-binding CsgD family transcriptional regulator
MNRKRKIDLEELKRLWNQKTSKELAIHFHTSVSYINTLGRKLKLPLRVRGKERKVNLNELRRLWSQKTNQEIATHFNVTVSYIASLRQKHNLPYRRNPRRTDEKKLADRLEEIAIKCDVSLNNEQCLEIAAICIEHLNIKRKQENYFRWVIYYYLCHNCAIYVPIQQFRNLEHLHTKHQLAIKEALSTVLGSCSIKNRILHLIHEHYQEIGFELAKITGGDSTKTADKVRDQAYHYAKQVNQASSPVVIACTCTYLAALKIASNVNSIGLSQNYVSDLFGVSDVSIRSQLHRFFSIEYQTIKEKIQTRPHNRPIQTNRDLTIFGNHVRSCIQTIIPIIYVILQDSYRALSTSDIRDRMIKISKIAPYITKNHDHFCFKEIRLSALIRKCVIQSPNIIQVGKSYGINGRYYIKLSERAGRCIDMIKEGYDLTGKDILVGCKEIPNWKSTLFNRARNELKTKKLLDFCFSRYINILILPKLVAYFNKEV